jgi:hypothetical protein
MKEDQSRRVTMTAIVCDACKKAVPGARKDENYFSLLDKDICEPCHDNLRDAVKKQMRTRRPYLFKDYQELLTRNLGQMTGR